MMIDDVNTKYDQKEPKKEKVDESRFGWWWCAPRRGKTLPACLPGRVSCTIKCCYTREIVLMAFYTCVFCFVRWRIWQRSTTILLVSRSLFLSFCFLLLFWLLQVNSCGKLCCRFHFLPNCTQQSTDFILYVCLTLVDLIIHYKYINRNIHLICTVVVNRTVISTIPEEKEKNMFNKQKLRMIRCIQYYRITPFILILLFAIHKLTLQNKDR